ncbi:transposase [Sphingobium fuliginis]|uniref:transposase n=1 Tax=Sphingobium fuliginis (strain ATCC 27551) TaxID=336203 RepID=UPI00210012AC|nr:transposase [Sphingobium fuliginis]
MPFDPVAMLKVLSGQHNISDARMEYLIRERLRWLRNLGLHCRAAATNAHWTQNFVNGKPMQDHVRWCNPTIQRSEPGSRGPATG